MVNSCGGIHDREENREARQSFTQNGKEREVSDNDSMKKRI